MGLKVDFNILNQKGTPAFYSDTFANRPAFGFAGRVFISTDTGAIYEDTGSTWTLIADAGAGTTGTLEQVTTNGNTTTKGITITAGGLSSNTLTSTGLTTGSILFSGAGGLLSQKNANLFWDNTNNRLGINNASPSAPLDIHGTGTTATFNGTGANNGFIAFQNAGVTKWTIGNQYASGTNNFTLINSAGNSVFNITGGTQSNFQYSLVSLGTFSASYVGDQIRVAGGALDAQIKTASGNNLMFIGATSTGYGANIDLSTGSLAITDTVTATRFVLSGATSPSGLYYTSNRVTVANYTAAGTVVIEVNGGGNAATFNADLSTDFSGRITATAATINGNVNITNGAYSLINLTGSSFSQINSTANLLLDAGTGYYVALRPNGNNEAMRAFPSLNVGIGTTTDNGYKLNVIGNIRSFISNLGGLGGNIQLLNDFGNNGGYTILNMQNAGTICFIKAIVNGPNSNSGADLQFGTPSTDVNGTVRFSIKSTGILNATNTPIYASNALALAGGLVVGDIYKSATGILSIVY